MTPRSTPAALRPPASYKPGGPFHEWDSPMYQLAIAQFDQAAQRTDLDANEATIPARGVHPA